MGAKNSPTSLLPSKKNLGKVPKRIHKAEREKMKREHLNELFLKLAEALEVGEQNSGKASILGETTRFIKVMLDQIKSLKKENAALLSESQYVKLEKNEIEDETCGLQIQIGELKRRLTVKEEKKLDLNAPPIESQEQQCLMEDSPIVNPVFVFPACLNFQGGGGDGDGGVVKAASNVRKPHPRYPTSLDSWHFQLLP
ncbi:transcription factor bHLH47-like [Cynara cardunculus var. scolymus]|nr:transcription factor bHLH47-like [Cynara cardunculus var. scolymus]XP_024964693.1 transcription factor bHLH47-like [Cynara cardunculus var. scolymus]